LIKLVLDYAYSYTEDPEGPWQRLILFPGLTENAGPENGGPK